MTCFSPRCGVICGQSEIYRCFEHLSAFERFLARICFEISSDVFEFTKNLACIVHENRRSQQEKYKLTAWNSGQILKLSVARHLRGS